MKSDNVDTRLSDGQQGIIKAVLEALDERERSGSGGSGSGGRRDDGSNSDWKQTVETRLTELRSDFRLLLTGIAGVAALIIGLYVWVGFKFDAVNEKAYSITEKNAVIDARTSNMENNISDIKQRMEIINSKLDSLVSNQNKK